MPIQVTVDLSPVEELQDFLTSYAWDLISDTVAEDCILSRRFLLTHLAADEPKRIYHVTKLQTYKYLFDRIFKQSGKNSMPSKYLELFTGAEKE
jgi:hypothetical protein